MAGRTYGLLGRARRTRVERLLDQFELRSHADQPYNELSTGLKQRLGLEGDPDRATAQNRRKVTKSTRAGLMRSSIRTCWRARPMC